MPRSRKAQTIRSGAILTVVMLVLALVMVAGFTDAALAANPWVDRP
jgi:hypothetical protein